MKTEAILIRMEPDLKDALQQVADERGSNIAQIVRQACLEHLKKSGITLRKSKKKGDDER